MLVSNISYHHGSVVFIPRFFNSYKAGLCLSHSSSIKLVAVCGSDFDSVIKQWKKDTEDTLAVTQVFV